MLSFIFTYQQLLSSAVYWWSPDDQAAAVKMLRLSCSSLQLTSLFVLLHGWKTKEWCIIATYWQRVMLYQEYEMQLCFTIEDVIFIPNTTFYIRFMHFFIAVPFNQAFAHKCIFNSGFEEYNSLLVV